MSDANACYDNGGNVIKGDKCIWYLCTNEKVGYLFLKTKNYVHQIEWGMGQSSYKTIKKFVEILQQENLIDDRQYSLLMEEISIAKTLGDMYEISNYLETIEEGKKWIPKITPTKRKMRQMVSDVKEKLTENNHTIIGVDEYVRANDT
jgi:hypothetical protein